MDMVPVKYLGIAFMDITGNIRTGANLILITIIPAAFGLEKAISRVEIPEKYLGTGTIFPGDTGCGFALNLLG